jgi:hypothetical protein
VILIYPVVGTVMELFKTHMCSWTYPEPALIRIAGVPLFSGFMGGFKRSSQHSEVGGCDEHSKAAVGSVWTSAIAVTGSAPCGGAR